MNRKIVFPLCVILAYVLGACSTNTSSAKVPSVVRNALDARYPNAADVEWKAGPNGYEAEFGPERAEVTVNIASSGKFLRQKTELETAALPPVILEKIRADYNHAEIDDVEKVEADGLTYYQIELERKGAEDTELVLDADGRAQTQIPYWD